MLAVTGKKLSALYREIEAQYGALSYAEASFTMTPARKLALQQYLFEQHACPEFECVDHISREDGCKVYFTDGSWVICRFSGTEPLLRMAAEAETDEKKPSPISGHGKLSCRSEHKTDQPPLTAQDTAGEVLLLLLGILKKRT